MDDNQLYRLPEIAEHLGLTEFRVFTLLQTRALPSSTMPDGSRAVRGEDIRTYAAANARAIAEIQRQHNIWLAHCDAANPTLTQQDQPTTDPCNPNPLQIKAIHNER